MSTDAAPINLRDRRRLRAMDADAIRRRAAFLDALRDLRRGDLWIDDARRVQRVVPSVVRLTLDDDLPGEKR